MKHLDFLKNPKAMLQIALWAIVTAGAIVTMTVDRYKGEEARENVSAILERLEKIELVCVK